MQYLAARTEFETILACMVVVHTEIKMKVSVVPLGICGGTAM